MLSFDPHRDLKKKEILVLKEAIPRVKKYLFFLNWRAFSLTVQASEKVRQFQNTSKQINFFRQSSRSYIVLDLELHAIRER